VAENFFLSYKMALLLPEAMLTCTHWLEGDFPQTGSGGKIND
jgi:hypothetical protein